MEATDRWPKRGEWNPFARGIIIGPIKSGDMSKVDALIEVARMLKDARSIAAGCSDRTLVYFVDMAIFEACETLAVLRGAGSAYTAQKNLCAVAT